jgi:hypothetical protein
MERFPGILSTIASPGGLLVWVFALLVARRPQGSIDGVSRTSVICGN